jgi:arsenate reductase
MYNKTVTIWHNKNCSTSKKMLDWLTTNFKEVKIRLYTQEIPSIEELKELISLMNVDIKGIIRTKDKVFQNEFKDKDLTKEEWLEALHNNPTMIERPIIIFDDKAIMGRPVDEAIEKIILFIENKK